MKVMVELSCCVVVLVILGGVLQVHSWQQKQPADHALPNPDWVSRPAGAEAYARLKNASEKYGRYQWVMAPQRESLGTDLSGKATVDGDEAFRHRVQWTDQLAEVDLELVCQPGYGAGEVSGGWVSLQNGDQAWQLRFRNVGAEGVLFADEPVPGWVLALCQSREFGVSQNGCQDDFGGLVGIDFEPGEWDECAEGLLAEFKDLYRATQDFDESVQRGCSRRISGTLIRLADLVFVPGEKGDSPTGIVSTGE